VDIHGDHRARWACLNPKFVPSKVFFMYKKNLLLHLAMISVLDELSNLANKKLKYLFKNKNCNKGCGSGSELRWKNGSDHRKKTIWIRIIRPHKIHSLCFQFKFSKLVLSESEASAYSSICVSKEYMGLLQTFSVLLPN